MGACATRPTSETTPLKLACWGSAEEIKTLEGLLRQFESIHPNIRVQLMHIPENYFQKIHILLAGGLAPDVFFVNSLNLPVYAQAGVIRNLSPTDLKHAHIPTEKFFQQAWRAMSFQHQIYAVPRDVSNLVVYYNQDLFDQMGVAYPNPGWTWTDLLEMGQRLTRDANYDGVRDQFAFSFYSKPALFWAPFVWSGGGRFFSNDFHQFGLSALPAMKALQFYADLKNRWHITPSRQEVGSANMSQLFIQGKLAMMLSGRWSVPVLRQQARFRWDVVPFPRGPKGSVVGIDASGYAISKDTPYVSQSLELVAFLSSQGAQETFTKSGLIIPARQDVAMSPVFLDVAQQPRHAQTFLDVIKTGYPTQTNPVWEEMAELINVALEPVWEGKQTVESAMKRLDPKVEKLLK